MKLFQRWKQTAIHNQVLVIATVFMAVGTVFYAGAAAFQIWLMSSGGKHTDEQIGYVIGNINWLARSMDESKREAEINNRQTIALAQQSIDASRDQIRLDERPWVYAPYARLVAEPTESTPATVILDLFNSGKTPAFEARTYTHLMSFNKARRIDWDKEIKGLPQKPTMIPPQIKGLTTKTAPLALVNSLANYNAGTNFIFIYAKITYRDAFGFSHWTTVCMFHRHGEPLGDFDGCEIGNDMDRTEYQHQR